MDLKLWIIIDDNGLTRSGDDYSEGDEDGGDGDKGGEGGEGSGGEDGGGDDGHDGDGDDGHEGRRLCSVSGSSSSSWLKQLFLLRPPRVVTNNWLPLLQLYNR